MLGGGVDVGFVVFGGVFVLVFGVAMVVVVVMVLMCWWYCWRCSGGAGVLLLLVLLVVLLVLLVLALGWCFAMLLPSSAPPSSPSPLPNAAMVLPVTCDGVLP